MNAVHDKPLGVVRVDLGPRNRAKWSRLFRCNECGKRLDQNTEVFGEYRRHNARMGILEWSCCCSACGTKDGGTDFVRASRVNGPVLQLNGSDVIIKPSAKNPLIARLSGFWFALSLRLGIERIN